MSLADKLAADVIGRARIKNASLATAESCTGGIIGGTLTNIPGASTAYLGGVIAYANEIKENVLGVAGPTLTTHGAVSAEVAREMATGARSHLGADIAVSVTGIAGPGGGSPEKPVGLVYIGLADAKGVSAERHLFTGGGRDFVRTRTVEAALRLILRALA